MERMGCNLATFQLHFVFNYVSLATFRSARVFIWLCVLALFVFRMCEKVLDMFSKLHNLKIAPNQIFDASNVHLLGGFQGCGYAVWALLDALAV